MVFMAKAAFSNRLSQRVPFAVWDTEPTVFIGVAAFFAACSTFFEKK